MGEGVRRLGGELHQVWTVWAGMCLGQSLPLEIVHGMMVVCHSCDLGGHQDERQLERQKKTQ